MMQSLVRGGCFLLALAFVSHVSAESVVLIDDPGDLAGGGGWWESESFEGLDPSDPNLRRLLPTAGVLEPGILAPFTFSSGLTMTAPIPNPGAFSNESGYGVFVGDWSLGPAPFQVGGGANTVSSADDVPFGDAYFGASRGTGTSDTISVEFILPYSPSKAFGSSAHPAGHRIDTDQRSTLAYSRRFRSAMSFS